MYSRETDRYTDGQMDAGRMSRQADRKMDGRTFGHTDSLTGEKIQRNTATMGRGICLKCGISFIRLDEFCKLLEKKTEKGEEIEKYSFTL